MAICLHSTEPPVWGESNRNLNLTGSSRTGSDTKDTENWKNQPEDLPCLCAFLDCSTWGGIWQQHKGDFCLSAYGIAWCIPAGKGFVPVYSFGVETGYSFILGELLNVQDSLSSMRTCINRVSAKLLNRAWSSYKFKTTGVEHRSSLKAGL